MFGNLVFVIPLIMLPLVFVLLILAVIYVRTPLDIEKSKQPIYSEICGGFIGFSNSTYPFVKISMYDEFLVIKKLFNTVVLNYSDITDVSIGQLTMIRHGVKITHNRSDIPERIFIWSFNQNILFEKLQNILKK